MINTSKKEIDKLRKLLIESTSELVKEKAKAKLELIDSSQATYHAFDLHGGVFKDMLVDDFFSGSLVDFKKLDLGVLIEEKRYDCVINLAHKNSILYGEYLAPYSSYTFKNQKKSKKIITTIRLITFTEDNKIFRAAYSLIENPDSIFTLKKSLKKKLYSFDFYSGKHKMDVGAIYPIPFKKIEGELDVLYQQRCRSFYHSLNLKSGR